MATGAMLFGCADDMDSAVPDPGSLNIQAGAGLAAPEFFADIDLRTYTTDTENLTQARVLIVDEGGEPMSGVGVYGSFTTSVQVDVQSYTDEYGVAYFEYSADDASDVGFQVDLASYEIGGDLVYVEVSSTQPTDPSEPGTLIDPTLVPNFDIDDMGAGIAEGISTSSGVEDPEEPGSSATYRTADPGQSSTSTTTSLTSEDSTTDLPDSKGISTSSG